MDESTNPKILIVEDDYENQRFLQLFLKKKFIVYVCDSEQSFYKYLNHYQIDVILMDISLRGQKDGLQLTREIKSNDKFKNIPVTMVTVELEREEIQKAIAGGAKNYLIKPFSQENLIGKIMEGLDMQP